MPKIFPLPAPWGVKTLSTFSKLLLPCPLPWEPSFDDLSVYDSISTFCPLLLGGPCAQSRDKRASRNTPVSCTGLLTASLAAVLPPATVRCYVHLPTTHIDALTPRCRWFLLFVINYQQQQKTHSHVSILDGEGPSQSGLS